MKIPPMVMVRWFDTFSYDGWQDVDDAIAWGGGRYEVKSVGWLIDESEDHILLSGSFSNNDKVCLSIHIPKVNIIKRIEIEWK